MSFGPQFFLPMITLCAMWPRNALHYKQELAQMREQSIDITHFEEDQRLRSGLR